VHEDVRPLSLQDEEDIRDRARHGTDISSDQLWALIEELDLTRKERGQQRAAKNAVLRSIDHPEIGHLLKESFVRMFGTNADCSASLAEQIRLRREIGEFLHAKSEKAERRQT